MISHGQERARRRCRRPAPLRRAARAHERLSA
jgi:hypothetical protein